MALNGPTFPPQTAQRARLGPSAPLGPGTLLGGRYEVERRLAAGAREGLEAVGAAHDLCRLEDLAWI